MTKYRQFGVFVAQLVRHLGLYHWVVFGVIVRCTSVQDGDQVYTDTETESLTWNEASTDVNALNKGKELSTYQ